MSAVNKEIFDQALTLPVDARVRLVEKLLGSLNVPTQKDVDELWAREAERRVLQIENKEVDLVSGEEVFAEIRKKHRR